MDPNTFYLDPCHDMDPGFWPNLDPYPDHEPGLTYQFLKKTLNKILKGIFFNIVSYRVGQPFFSQDCNVLAFFLVL